MADPRARLYRPIPGEPLHALPTAADRALGWDRERCVRAVEIAAHKEPRARNVRPTHNTREPGAYAPKLIRLVRHPYALEAGYFARRSAGDRARPEARERVSFTEATRRRTEPRLPFPKPSEARMRAAPRPRPSADAWLDGGAGQEAS
ncbi:MAG: hypothetical protein VX265_15265 [Myxococcota bacterium]|nr:hypothetical protein [Myxococcota bacterium]